MAASPVFVPSKALLHAFICMISLLFRVFRYDKYPPSDIRKQGFHFPCQSN